MKFSSPVTVLGTPRLWLDVGDADGYAEFNAMAGGTNDTLVFRYVVQEGIALVQTSMNPDGTPLREREHFANGRRFYYRRMRLRYQ